MVATRMGVHVALGDSDLSFLEESVSGPEDEESSEGWHSTPRLAVDADHFVELDDGRRVSAEFVTRMIFSFSGNMELTGEYQLDQISGSLRDAMFEDDDGHGRVRNGDDLRWNQLIERLTAAGVVGANKLALRSLPCVVVFEQDVAESVGIEADGVLTRVIEPRPPRRTDPPPPDLRRALDLITIDLEPGGAYGIELSLEPGREDDEMWMVHVRGADGSSGSGFVLDKPFSELVAMLADLIQEHVIDEIWGEWPACPHHGHPLAAWSDGETAFWVCGTDSTWMRAIGTLAADDEYVTTVQRRK